MRIFIILSVVILFPFYGCQTYFGNRVSSFFEKTDADTLILSMDDVFKTQIDSFFWVGWSFINEDLNAAFGFEYKGQWCWYEDFDKLIAFRNGRIYYEACINSYDYKLSFFNKDNVSDREYKVWDWKTTAFHNPFFICVRKRRPGSGESYCLTFYQEQMVSQLDNRHFIDDYEEQLFKKPFRRIGDGVIQKDDAKLFLEGAIYVKRANNVEGSEFASRILDKIILYSPKEFIYWYDKLSKYKKPVILCYLSSLPEDTDIAKISAAVKNTKTFHYKAKREILNAIN